MNIHNVIRDLFGGAAPFVGRFRNKHEIAFDQACRNYIAAGGSHERATAILIYNLELAGMVHRDDRGRFQAGEGGHTVVAAEAKQSVPPSPKVPGENSADDEGHAIHAAEVCDGMPTSSEESADGRLKIADAARPQVPEAETKVGHGTIADEATVLVPTETEGHRSDSSEVSDLLPSSDGAKAKPKPSLQAPSLTAMRVHAKSSIYALKTRDDTPIGELYHSQIKGRIDTNVFENRLYAAILDYGVPPEDKQIKDYIPASALEQMVASARIVPNV